MEKREGYTIPHANSITVFWLRSTFKWNFENFLTADYQLEFITAFLNVSMPPVLRVVVQDNKSLMGCIEYLLTLHCFFLSALVTSGAGCVALSDLLFQPFGHIVKNFTAFVQAFIKIGKHFSRRVSVDTSDIKSISLVNRYGVSKIDFLKYFFEMPLIHLLFPFRPFSCPLFPCCDYIVSVNLYFCKRHISQTYKLTFVQCVN